MHRIMWDVVPAFKSWFLRDRLKSVSLKWVLHLQCSFQEHFDAEIKTAMSSADLFFKRKAGQWTAWVEDSLFIYKVSNHKHRRITPWNFLSTSTIFCKLAELPARSVEFPTWTKMFLLRLHYFKLLKCWIFLNIAEPLLNFVEPWSSFLTQMQCWYFRIHAQKPWTSCWTCHQTSTPRRLACQERSSSTLQQMS